MLSECGQAGEASSFTDAAMAADPPRRFSETLCDRSWAGVSFGAMVTNMVRRHVLVCVLSCGVALAQDPELGRIERNGREAVLFVDGPRPLDSAASTLAGQFGIRVNVEDPAYIFQDDVKDVTAEVSRNPHITQPILIPKGGSLEVHFALGGDGKPADIPGLLRNA